jgi:hypothetical protein
VVKRIFSFDDAPRLTLCTVDIPNEAASMLVLIDSETGIVASKKIDQLIQVV